MGGQEKQDRMRQSLTLWLRVIINKNCILYLGKDGSFVSFLIVCDDGVFLIDQEKVPV